MVYVRTLLHVLETRVRTTAQYIVEVLLPDVRLFFAAVL